MINDNKNEAVKVKQIANIRHKKTYAKTQTYTQYKMYLSMMMLICNKQHLSNICSSIHDKVKQHLASQI